MVIKLLSGKRTEHVYPDLNPNNFAKLELSDQRIPGFSVTEILRLPYRLKSKMQNLLLG